VGDAELVDVAVEGIGDFRLRAVAMGRAQEKPARVFRSEDRRGQLSGHREWGERRER
jgi:hypothetical protein